MTGPAASELRVHGVGGSHGPRMLGFESAEDVVVVGEGVGGTSVLARRHDRSVESYDWGDLTSGSGTRALWVLLLPFTLINVAGWMHPPVGRTSLRKVKWNRGLVHVLSVLVTAAYVVTLGTIVVDLLGWQWVRHIRLPADPTRYGEGAAPLPSTLGAQRIGMWVGLVVLLGVIVAVTKLAGKSQDGFEGYPPKPQVEGAAGEERWGADEKLDGRGFFLHPTAARRRLSVHKAALFITWGGICVWSWFRAYRFSGNPPDRLEVGGLNGFTSVAGLVVILLLALCSWRNGRRTGERWVRCAPAIASVLGLALLNAVAAGTHLLLLKRLNDWPKRPAGAAMAASPEVALVDVWGAVTLALVVAAAVFVWRRSKAPPAKVKDRRSPPGHRPDGADPAMRTSIAQTRYLARWAHRAGGVALTFSLLLVVTYVVVVSWRGLFDRGEGFRPWLPAPTLDDLQGNNARAYLYRVGAYVLPFLVLFLVTLVSKSYRGARTFASTLWDVLTFWPRRFSPLAVRPYAERAVPELRGRIDYHVREEGHPVVVSAHSQGSILSFAALSSLAPDDLRRVGFVTYGSPITTIFAVFFPAYFGTDEVARLRKGLAGPGKDLQRWRNFYRLTDPIGGPIFTSGADPGDQELPDPGDRVLADPYDGPAGPRPADDPSARTRPPTVGSDRRALVLRTGAGAQALGPGPPFGPGLLTGPDFRTTARPRAGPAGSSCRRGRRRCTSASRRRPLACRARPRPRRREP